MISRAVLTRVDRQAIQGRTGPILSACEAANGEEVETFLKLSAGCDEGEVNLVREAIAACLAADLGLPIPKPWLVEIPSEIISVISDDRIVEKLQRSCRIAFGSTRAAGFSSWTNGQRLTDHTRPIAAGILLFDAVIQNPDRRLANPNCLVRGDELRIIDHELTFMHRLALFWKPPWVLGGMKNFETPGAHIFVSALKRSSIDFDPIKSRWANLSDERLREYEQAIPADWGCAKSTVDSALTLISDARNNIDDCVKELERVLS